MPDAQPDAPAERRAGLLAQTVRGSLLLAAATIVVQAIGFVALAYVARRVGADNLGAYGFALALTAYFTLPVNFGFTMLATREAAQAPERTRELMGEVLALAVPIGVVSYGALVAVGLTTAPSTLAAGLVPIIGLNVFATALNVDWALRVLRRLDLVAAALLASQLCYAAAIPFLVDEGRSGTYAYTALNAGGFLLGAALSHALIFRVAGPPRMRVRLGRLWDRLRRSVPLGLSFAMIQIYYSLDILMLGWLNGTRDVGLYTTAYKIPTALITLAGVWVSGFFPHSAELAKSDPDRLRRDLGIVTTFAIMAAVALSVGAAFTGGDLMVAMFGEDFRDAGPPFTVLVASAGVVLISVNFGNVLVALGQDRVFLAGATIGAVLNAALNVVVIPRFGPVGAAFATLVSEAVVVAVMVSRLRRTLGTPQVDVRRLGRALPALAAMTGAMYATDPMHPAVQIAAGGVALGAGMLLFGVATPDELRKVLPRRFRRDG